MSWNSLVYDFGKVVGNTRCYYNFIYNGNKTIREIIPSCGCTTTEILNNAIGVTYIAPYAPPGVKELTFEKSISVYFTDNTKDDLLIKGKVINING